MIDGILEWRNAWDNRDDEVACPFAMRPVLCHKVACIGENQAHVLSGWGNAGRTEIVGVPRFDCYPNVETTASKVDNRFRVLVMTAKTPAFTDSQWETVRQSLTDCKIYFDRHTDSFDITWRLTGGLQDYLGVTNTVSDLTGGQLRDQLQKVDAVISTPSTAVVEAMVAGKPTALLNYFDCPSYLNVAWQIRHGGEVESVIQQLRQADSRRLHYQQNQVLRTLYRETPASERFIHLVRTMQAKAAEKIAAGQPIEFESNLLPIPRASVADFSMPAMYPNDAEFENTDRVATQAQLAHSRRHISQLDRRIEQLETELKQAHEIFDEINQHPIAGPIVRVRERLLNTMAGFKRKVQTEGPA